VRLKLPFASRHSALVPSTTTSRTTVHYSGHVQGVGFRYTVVETARGYEVTGFVQNLTDGRVLLVAEGETREIEGFLSAIVERMSGYIRKAERSDALGERQHRGFTIR
jgi:acylphosphatase